MIPPLEIKVFILIFDQFLLLRHLEWTQLKFLNRIPHQNYLADIHNYYA